MRTPLGVDTVLDHLLEVEPFALWWEKQHENVHVAVTEALIDGLVDLDVPDNDPDDEGSSCVYLTKEEWMGDAFS